MTVKEHAGIFILRCDKIVHDEIPLTEEEKIYMSGGVIPLAWMIDYQNHKKRRILWQKETLT
mgnify:CR=1 FL=1